MGQHYIRRFDLSKYTLKSFDSADEICCDTNNSDLLTYDANGTNKVVVDTTSTQTLTNKTLSGATLSAGIDQDFAVLAATQTYTSTTVASTISGFSWSVVAGTYVFEVNLPITATTNGGTTISFKLTNSAVLTSIQYQTYAATASDNTTAVSTQGTTTTDATKVFDSKTAAYTLITIKGSMVVGTAGTFSWQATQNTSNTDTTSILLGSYAMLTRAS